MQYLTVATLLLATASASVLQPRQWNDWKGKETVTVYVTQEKPVPQIEYKTEYKTDYKTVTATTTEYKEKVVPTTIYKTEYKTAVSVGPTQTRKLQDTNYPSDRHRLQGEDCPNHSD